MTDISVIIPAYNAEKTIAACIESLLDQSLEEPFEVLVVDDGSTDNTPEIAHDYPQVRLLRQANSGASAARNLGAMRARGSILLFIDADCEATHGWTEALVGAIRAGAAGAKGTYRTRQRSLIARFVQAEYESKYDRMRRRARIDFIDTYSAAYRRDILLGAGQGGFDTTYPGASVEDQELSFRLAKMGYDLRFVEDAVVYHNHASTLRAYAARKFNIGRWKVRVHARHPDKALSDAHTPSSQKVQFFLAYGMAAVLVPAMFNPIARRALALQMALFKATTLPFTLKALRKDPPVGAVSPLLMLIRAACLAAGTARGALDFAVAIISGTSETH